MREAVLVCDKRTLWRLRQFFAVTDYRGVDSTTALASYRGVASTTAVGSYRGVARVAVALNDATTARPGSSPSRSRLSSVTSATSGASAPTSTET